jgi:CheY-like chemotaxis protein
VLCRSRSARDRRLVLGDQDDHAASLAIGLPGLGGRDQEAKRRRRPSARVPDAAARAPVVIPVGTPAAAARGAGTAGGDGRARGGLAGARVLVAEDQALLALDLEMPLRELGCAVLGPAASVAEALRLVGPGRPDAALLDLNLLDGSAVPVAAALASAGVPFALLTGHAGELPDHPALRGAPRLDKPFGGGELRQALARLLGQAPASRTTLTVTRSMSITDAVTIERDISILP